MDIIHVVEQYDRIDFEGEVQAMLNKGWKLINANSFAIKEPHQTQTYVCFHGFLIKEGSQACQPEPVEGTSNKSKIVNRK